MRILVLPLALWLAGLVGAGADGPPVCVVRYLEDLDPPQRREETAAVPTEFAVGGTAPWQAMGPEGGYVRGLVMEPMGRTPTSRLCHSGNSIPSSFAS